jgi:hypothetical protein
VRLRRRALGGVAAAAGDGQAGDGENGRKLFPLCRNFFTHLCVVTSESRATVSEMRKPIPFRPPHEHKAVTTYLLKQREGIPYEVARVQCSECSRVLDERQLRRAAA